MARLVHIWCHGCSKYDTQAFTAHPPECFQQKLLAFRMFKNRLSSAYLDLPPPSHTIVSAMRNLLRIDLFTFFLHPSHSFPVVGTAMTAAFSPGLLARHDLWAVISWWESGWPQLAAAKQSVGTFPAACLSHMDHSASCRISPIVRNSIATCERKTSTKLGVGPLARCSFEETEPQFIDAAVFAERNHPGLYSIGRVLFPLGSSSA
jgi:hypothetical protein